VPRPRKPSYLKLICGTDQPCRRNNHEPLPVGNLDDAPPPDWLTPAQKESWGRAIKHAPPGLLRLLDRGIFTLWIVAADLHRQAAEKVEKFGAVIKTKSGAPIQSPYLRIVSREARIMLKASAEMGFSPRTRARGDRAPSGGGRRTEANRFALLKEDD
jgi:P27 family predicted phage terminase small subunit